jgi:hypothetical protein
VIALVVADGRATVVGMAAEIIGIVAIVIGCLVAIAIIATIVMVVRNRPQQPARTHPDRYRVRGRSMRGWQASAIREIRRAGRQHGTRGR